MRFEDLVNRFDIVVKNLERRGSSVPDFSPMERLISKYQTLRQERETFAKMRNQLNVKTGFRKSAGRLKGKNQEGYQKAIAMLEQFDKQLKMMERLIRALASTWPKLPAASVPEGTEWREIKRHEATDEALGSKPLDQETLVTNIQQLFLEIGYQHAPKGFTHPASRDTLGGSLITQLPTHPARQDELTSAAEDIARILEEANYAYRWLECPVKRLPVYAHKQYVFSVSVLGEQHVTIQLVLDDTGTVHSTDNATQQHHLIVLSCKNLR
ncbi:MAG: hypothetical protein EA374_00940 [Acholeplasmatales bacterium]|nr:MAG: hypothetical protein EA374_00940 [Acholeplasmatales bacterium]